MKKILLTILLCLYMTNVSALTYSDYSEFSEYTDEVIYADDLTDVKTERRYKYYKLTKELGPYEKEENINSNYPLIDYDDYTYTKESEYLMEQPEAVKGRIITPHDVYHYKTAKEFNYIEIKNNNTKNVDINTTNLSIQYNDKPIDYILETNNVTGDTINQNGYMRFKFAKPLELRYLNLEFHADSSSNGTVKIIITAKKDDFLISEVGYNYNDKSSVDIMCKGKNMTLESNAYQDYYTDTYEVPGINLRFQGKVTAYTYKDILYRKYKLEKEYYPEYLTQSIDEYIYQDSDNYKDYYAKRTRIIIPEIDYSEELEEYPNEDDEEGQAIINVNNNIVKKMLTKNKNITGIQKLNKPLTKKDQKPNYKKPTMLLKIDNDNIYDDNSLNNDYKIIKTNNKNTDIEKPIQNHHYLSYILIILIFLALLLSKLYKKKK